MIFECRDISFRYPGTEVAVFENLAFRMAGPGFNALFGPSGVGKTSLAHILTGVLKGFAGQIETPGIQTVLYSYNLERLPGWSAVGKHLERVTAPAQQGKKAPLVQLFGMAPHLGARFAQLSLGQKNRINLMRYLLQDFDLLVMDESLANVDEPTRNRIILEIKALFPDKFFLYISHNVIEVAKFCKHVLVLGGPGKEPNAVMVSGLDHRSEAPPDRRQLERAMLEIMNAA